MTGGRFNWRDYLAVHPAAEAFPLLSEKELKELAGDIKRNSLRERIVIWSAGEPDAHDEFLLDGRNRLDALALLGRLELDERGRLCTKGADGELREIRLGYITGGDPVAIAYSLNVHRRHLTANKKRELIANLLKAQSERSDRQIAETVKASPTTVGAVRRKMEAKGEVSKLDTRIDRRGIEQPARKTARARRAEQRRQKREAERQGAITRRRREKELLAVEVERLASKLIALDRDTARALHQLLWDHHDRCIDRLVGALAHGLGLDDTDEPSVDDGLDIPECLRRAPKAVAP